MLFQTIDTGTGRPLLVDKIVYSDQSQGQVQSMVEQMNKQLAAEGKARFQWKTIPQGAATSVWAGVVAPADGVGGQYCENCHVGHVVADKVMPWEIAAL